MTISKELLDELLSGVDMKTNVDARNHMSVRQCDRGRAAREELQPLRLCGQGPRELLRRKPLGCRACDCKRAGVQPPGSVPGTRPSSGALGDQNSTGAAA